MQLLLSLYIPHLPTSALQVLYKLLIRIGPWGELVATSPLAGGTRLSHSLPLPPQGPLGMLRAGAWGRGGAGAVQTCVFCFPPPGGLTLLPTLHSCVMGNAMAQVPAAALPVLAGLQGQPGLGPCWLKDAGSLLQERQWGHRDPSWGCMGTVPPLAGATCSCVLQPCRASQDGGSGQGSEDLEKLMGRMGCCWGWGCSGQGEQGRKGFESRW